MPTTTGLATSFITFSRPGASGGGATTTDRDGKIKWAGHNLLTNSESFDASAWNQFLTTVTANSTVAPNGTTTADTITNSGNTAGIYQFANVSPGASYTFAFWAKRGTSTSANYSIFDATNAADIVATTSYYSSIDATGWSLITLNFTAPTGCTSVRCYPLRAPATTGTIFFWGAHLYRSDLGGMQLNPAMPAGMQSYYPTTPRNLLGYTEDFSNAAWAKSGSGVAAPVVTSNAIVAPNGLQTADRIDFPAVSGVNAYSQFNWLFTATAAPYTASIWLRGVAGGEVVYLMLTNNGTNAVVETCTLTTSWQRFSLTSTRVAAGDYLQIGVDLRSALQSAKPAQSLYAWGAQLSDSASLDTYVPVYGAAVTSAAYYAPRLDFDGATLAAKGLLVEELRTNLCLYSQSINLTNFSNLGGAVPTVTQNTTDVTSPDGRNTASKVDVSAASIIGQNITVTSGIAYTMSVFVRPAVDGTQIRLGWFDTLDRKVDFTLSGAGTFSNLTNATSAQITAVGNGWYRCSITATTSSTAAQGRFFYPLAASVIYCWGAQLEAGSFATSYIPNGSAVAGATRAADVASVSTGAFPYSATEGTLVVNAVATLDSGVFVQMDDGTQNNRIIARAVGGSTALQYIISGGTEKTLSVGTFASGTTVKVAIAAKLNDSAASANGGTVATETSVNMPAAATTLRIGADAAGAYSSTWIRQVTYLPRRISNAELISRTS